MTKVLSNLLSDYGYNLVALPKTDIKPLLLLFKKDDGLGSVDASLEMLFTSEDASLPQPEPDADVADIKGSATFTFDAKAGISILNCILAKLNLGKGSVNLNLDANNSVTISYQEITESKVNLLELDNYISSSTPNIKQFSSFQRKLQNSDLYVISAVLKSNSFSVQVEDENGHNVNVDAAFEGIANATINAGHKGGNSVLLNYSREKPIIFAFKAQRIIYDKPKWWDLTSDGLPRFWIRNQQGEVLKDESEFPTDQLNADDELVDI